MTVYLRRLIAFLYLEQRGQRNERVQFIDQAARSTNQIGEKTRAKEAKRNCTKTNLIGCGYYPFHRFTPKRCKSIAHASFISI